MYIIRSSQKKKKKKKKKRRISNQLCEMSNQNGVLKEKVILSKKN